VPRERVVPVRDRVPVLREDFAAPPLLALRVPLEVPAPALDDFARVDVDFFAPPVERELLVERLAVDRELVADLRPPLLRPDDEDPELPPLLAEPSKLHLPDITRWAASATASAMMEPSLVALETTLLAACEAVSAASSPASRIFLRAAGLALIAAAAAASPAASISLLIAALASLSIVSLDPEPDEEELEPPFSVEREELLRADLAIFCLPPSLRNKTLQGCFGSLMTCAPQK
jgi:hypothetical protein